MSDPCALLMTDVVDSTSLTAQLGDAESARLWAAHDRLARDLLPAHRGREIDKSDGLLLLFSQAGDAVRYAAAYHAALRSLHTPLAARAGLHVGDVILRENSAADVARGAKPMEVEGIAKAIAARIMSLAHAGQTLMSAAAKHALGDTAGLRLRLQSHGHWRLKGFAEPVELFEAGDAQALFEPPTDHAKAYRVARDGELWLPLKQVKCSLPAERDAFVGRRDALDELARQYDAGARLVCVTGIGGTGKTRLAIRFAWTWLGEFPGGVWFCDLAQARSVDGIAFAVSHALDVPLGKEDPLVQLGNAIQARGACLVILDNFEQVSRHAEATLGGWLNRAREASFLVTSRNVLGMAGETALPLSPLAPDDAAALFLRRARAAKPDFQPRDEDEAAIVPLVRLLDGLPLAIELAAARVRVMPPRVLLARMSERFRLLSSSGARLERQATLRAAFDWSWDLLSAAEKAALAQLSVFEGGFTLDAVESVLDLALVGEAPWAPDVLQSLVEKSLVRPAQNERFDLLVSVREYASQRLHAEGEGAVLAAQARHSAWFAGLDERQATAQRCVELDNLVAACRHAVARGDALTATRSLELAWAAVQLRGPFAVGVELAAQAGAMPGLPAALAARVHGVAARALQALGRVAEAQEHCRGALHQAREVGDRRCEARLLSSLGSMDTNASRIDRAREHLTTAFAIARQIEDRTLECEALNGLGTLDHYVGRTEEARGHYEAALAVARHIGDRRWEGGVLGNLGTLDASAGRMAQARVHFQAGLVVARELGNRHWEGNALCNLGLLHQVQGELNEARQKLQEALQVAREMGHARLGAIVLCNLGIVHDSLGELDQARSDYEAALAVARDLDDRRSAGQFLAYLGALNARQGRFDEARGQLDDGAALLRDASDRFYLGVLLCGRAELEALSGRAQQAQATLAEAQAIADELGAGSGSELAAALERAHARLRQEPRAAGATGC